MSHASGRARSIVVATDGSRSSTDAITFAVELAAEHGWQVVFVHVIPTIDVAPAFGFGEVGLAVPHEPSERDHALLTEAAKFAADHGVPASTALLGGSPTTEIVDHADRCEADMIVVGSHGHRRIASAILGSVSLGVLGASKRPVLVVRGTSPFHVDVAQQSVT